jgi:hypothetical protein
MIDFESLLGRLWLAGDIHTCEETESDTVIPVRDLAKGRHIPL